MNDIQREFLYVLTIFILSTLGAYKLLEIIIFILTHLPLNVRFVCLLLFVVAFMFKLRFDAYKRKGGQ